MTIIKLNGHSVIKYNNGAWKFHNPHGPAFNSDIETSYWQNGKCHNIVGYGKLLRGIVTYRINHMEIE